ncbi:MAG TPA: EscU/YscU/HrcU family type III secretion system export apparatus switch protein [Bryobacteraceae bacterium]|jgi:flagellar biosynthetic protein FlhB|nr:EscU/YscU/HrcU family type III secretion system export apparatus switch protein [Bryobacteraceae bacterium]
MSEQKTEKPTARRLKKARDEGNFPTSHSFVAALQFLAFVSMLASWGPEWVQNFRLRFASLLQDQLNPRRAPMDQLSAGIGLIKDALIPVLIMGSVLIVITLAVQTVVTGFGISLKKLTPDFSRLSPLSKLKQLPRQNLSGVIQAAIMIPVFAAAIYYLVADKLEVYLTLPLRGLEDGTLQMVASLESLLWKAAGLFLVFGIVDLVRQKTRYERDLKMSKQEIRDESKETDGNPVIKGRIRRIRRDLVRRRMMHEVATATAVVVNPTHYAVALKYSPETKGAPRVVAKGKNFLALRIRQRALENQIPLIENPPLAQGLYKSVDVGQEIPAHFYKAVAEILAYIYRIMNGRRTA